jgi:transcription-repair coupling factor (superfamily II helicase)
VKLDGLLPLLRGDDAYQEFVERARRFLLHPGEAAGDGRPRFPRLSLQIIEAARPAVIAALQCDWPGPIVVVSGRPEQARHVAEQVRAWSATPEQVTHFAAPDTLFYDRAPWDSETICSRVNVLATLTALGGEAERGRGLVVTTSMWALMTKSVTPMALRRATRTVHKGDLISPYRFLEAGVRAGYEPATVVETPGTFCHRGSIVDIFPPNLAEPIRIDFFGDEIDSIRTFSPATQRSLETLSEATLAPASEALPEWGKQAAPALQALDLAHCNAAAQQRLSEEREQIIAGHHVAGIEFYLPYLYPRPGALLEFLPPGALLLLEDVVSLETAALGLDNQALGLRAEMVQDGDLPANFAAPYWAWDSLKERLARFGAVSLGFGAEEEDSALGQGFIPAPRYSGHLQDALADLSELRQGGQRVVVVTRQAERLSDLLREQHVYVSPVAELAEPPAPGTLAMVDGILAEGWAHRPSQLVVLTDAEIFGWMRLRRRTPPPRRRAAPESLFADLREGDYVVHVEYGIGRYHGMTRKTIAGLEREYIEIEYANRDRLYVPIHQADRVSRYLGADDREPYIHRLGGAEWGAVREKAQKAVRDMARELLELYATREVTPGYAFHSDTEWQHEMEASFPYEETEDQLRAVIEVKADMGTPRPMDRLVCGDVGYGKTEVALRAAFKSVMEGKQVAVLVPTTVLAQQHFHTFRRRLRAFPVVVEMLSRFRSPAEQDEIIAGLRQGKVDIVVGTHRLLSGDVSFKDLGLLVIDEEQRFGVTHKERLKQLRREVDVLTMTATPIPRTMYMALSGIRDMSVIDTPPESRLAVRTTMQEYDEALVRKAILRELDRGGQVYYVHNRVQDIELVAVELRRIVPDAAIVIGHGQMPEDQLAQVMLGFAQGEADVLLCTTIIENGLDIPNVNTIIIDRADTFGLGQLYQLRGRVGRGVNRAHAYLLYKPPLTEIALKRLQTIQEASELGAGLRVAMRDMEIRGAGEILGAEQHGHIAAIGFDLYTRLLQQAVEELRQASGETMQAMRRAQHAVAAQALALHLGPSVDLPVTAYLPEDFIPDDALRLRLYRRLARVETLHELGGLRREWRDRFGELPAPVEGLLYVLQVRVLAAQVGVESVKGDPSQVVLTLPQPLHHNAAHELAGRLPNVAARGAHVRLPFAEGWRERLLEALQALETDHR